MAEKKEMYNEKETWEQRAKTLLSLAQRVIERSGEGIAQYNSYKLLAKAFLHSANDDFKAILVLMSSGLFTQAAMILRRLFELVINLRYIARCPETRVEQYRKFDPIERHKYLEIWDKHDPDAMSEEDRSRIQTMYREVMESLGYEKPPALSRWSGCSLQDRAKDVGGTWPKQYDYIYKVCCLYSHVSPTGLANCFKVTRSGALEYEQPLSVRRVVGRVAVVYFLSIIDRTDKILDTGLRTEIERTWTNVQSSSG